MSKTIHPMVYAAAARAHEEEAYKRHMENPQLLIVSRESALSYLYHSMEWTDLHIAVMKHYKIRLIDVAKGRLQDHVLSDAPSP